METTPTPTESKQKTTMRKALLVLNCILLIIGNCGGPLITRLYYVSGGKLIWLQSCLQTAAFPLLLLPLTASYLHRGCNNLVLIKHRLLITAAVVGILTGLDNYFFAYGLAYLPVSTSTLIIGTQLAFTATFAFFLVKQKFVFHSTNSVVLLTVAAVVLALRSSGDRPEGVTSREYVRGFMMTVAAAALYGLILPLVELSYMKGKQRISYALVLEMQFVICILATSFCAVGMLINKDFQAIPKEAREFKLGEVKYYIVLVFSAIVWQGYFLGAIGIVFCSSSLLSGIVIAGTLPLTEFLAVAFYREKFQPEKGVALALALWGFASYFYGELKRNKTQLQINTETELPQVLDSRV